MKIVILTALGVGGATVFGAVFGLLFRKTNEKINSILIAFAAGVMLASSVFGLIIPAVEDGGSFSLGMTVIGIILGAALMKLLDVFSVRIFDSIAENKEGNQEMRRAFLFLLAVTLHNFPEGIAAGVGFGGGDFASALVIAGGIALQNIPEGMVVVSPLIAAGYSPKRSFFYSAFSGFVEIVGTVIGYFFVSFVSGFLSIFLSFAGGAMLYIISSEMLPDKNEEDSGGSFAFSFIIGFCLVLLINYLL